MIPKGVSQYNPKWLNASPVPSSGGDVTSGSLPNGGGSAKAVGQPKIDVYNGIDAPKERGLFDKTIDSPANSTPGDSKPDYPSAPAYGGGVTTYYASGSVPSGELPVGRRQPTSANGRAE